MVYEQFRDFRVTKSGLARGRWSYLYQCARLPRYFLHNQMKQNWWVNPLHRSLSSLHSVHLLQMLPPLETGCNIAEVSCSPMSQRGLYLGNRMPEVSVSQYPDSDSVLWDEWLADLWTNYTPRHSSSCKGVNLVTPCSLKNLPCQQQERLILCPLLVDVRDNPVKLWRLMRTRLLLTWVKSELVLIAQPSFLVSWCGGSAESHSISLPFGECLNGPPISSPKHLALLGKKEFLWIYSFFWSTIVNGWPMSDW